MDKIVDDYSHIILIDDLFISQFGNKVGAGQFRGKTLPTYVYPDCIKDVVREIIQENLRDYQDPESATVTCFYSFFNHTHTHFIYLSQITEAIVARS